MQRTKRSPPAWSTLASISTGRSTRCGRLEAIVALEARLVEQVERREVGGAARVDRAFRLDRLAAVEDERILAHRHHLGAEPILLLAERRDHMGVEIGGGEAALPGLQIAGEAGKGDVEARPAAGDDRLEQRARVFVQIGVGEQPIAFAAERLVLLDDQERHVRAMARQRQRGEAPGQPAARNQDSVSPAPRHKPPPVRKPDGDGATGPVEEAHFGTIRARPHRRRARRRRSRRR